VLTFLGQHTQPRIGPSTENNLKKSLFLALAVLALIPSFPLAASDDPKTLPPAAYEQMKSGNKLDKIWLDPTYDKAKGFKVGPVVYKAENRNGEVMDYLGKALATLGNPESPYTLKVAVVKVTTKHGVVLGTTPGAVNVEGQISDPEGKVVVCFIANGKAGAGWANGNGLKDDYPAACDKIASAIAKDLQ
jgi:hypothetical protein